MLKHFNLDLMDLNEGLLKKVRLHRCSASSEIPGGSMASEVGYGSWCQTSVDRIRMNLNFEPGKMSIYVDVFI